MTNAIQTAARTALLSLTLLTLSVAALAFDEGVHYERIGSPVDAPTDRVEVVEAFAYPCPACYNFHPIIERWVAEAPDHVQFSRLPIGLQRGWDMFALAYYTADVMSVDDAAHGAVFRAIHDERRRIRNFEDIAAIYADFGVDAADFVATAESFAVDARMRRNRADVTRFGIRQTPTMVVQGKWRVVPGAFNSYQEMLQAVDFLVAREAELLASQVDEGETVAEQDPVDSE